MGSDIRRRSILIVLCRECGIQTDQVVIESQLGNERTVIHFNDLVIDVNKSTEVAPPEIRADAAAQGEIRRTFK